MSPVYLADQGWQTVERNVADVFAAIGMGSRWRGGRRGDAITPGYVTRRNASAGRTLEGRWWPKTQLKFVPAALDDALAQPLLAELAVEYATALRQAQCRRCWRG